MITLIQPGHISAGKGLASDLQPECESAVRSSALIAKWPLCITFLLALLVPVSYIVAAVAGWIDWLVWSPIFVTSLSIAWLCACLINSMERCSSTTA